MVIGDRDAESDHAGREIGVTDKLRQIRSEFLVLSWIGVGTSTVYGSWVLGHAAISNMQSPLCTVFFVMGVAVALCEWYLFRKLARAVLGEHIGRFLPGLSSSMEANAQALRAPMLARLIFAGCMALSASLAAMILWRFTSLLASVALFSVMMLVGLSFIGMLIVLRR